MVKRKKKLKKRYKKLTTPLHLIPPGIYKAKFSGVRVSGDGRVQYVGLEIVG